MDYKKFNNKYSFEKFKNYICQNTQQNIMKMETIRKIFLFLFVLFLGFFICLIWLYGTKIEKQFIQVLLVFSIIPITFLMLLEKIYQNMVKKYILPLFTSFFEKFKYENKAKRKHIKASYIKNLFNLPATINLILFYNISSNLIQIKYDSKNIDIYKLKISDYGSDIFDGILIKINIDTEKVINCCMVITRKNKYFNSKNFKKIETNNHLFNKYFDVYCDEIVNIENILTTEFMNKMIDIVNVDNILLNNIRISFEKKYMNITIPNNFQFFDMTSQCFKFPFFKSLLNLDNYHDIYTKLSLILFIIDTLCTQKEVEENFGEN